MSSFLRSLFLFLMILFILFSINHIHGTSNKIEHSSGQGDISQSTSIMQKLPFPSHRKLLIYGRCKNRDISISQCRDSISGIPQYIVQIVNTCNSGLCAPSNIHLNCGWFASARIVNPRTFKRLSYDDCLVNGGMPLKTSQVIRFTYSNSFMYPLSFKSANFC